mgnify:CR=1 FL=1|jgi:hypothetical protein
MEKINWKQKLTSRKLWAAIAGFIVAVLAFFSVDEETVVRVTALITAGSTMIAYIIGEGLVDANRPPEPEQPPDGQPPTLER